MNDEERREIDRQCASFMGIDMSIAPAHDWERYADGEIDTVAWDADRHNGPRCKRCAYFFCHHCDPDGYTAEPCQIDPPHYSSSPLQARLLEDAIEQRGLQKEYMDALADTADALPFDDVLYPWALIRATPEQRARAFLAVMMEHQISSST